MTSIPIYQIDAFTATLFAGNPAAICPLDGWLDATTLQAIAAKNYLAVFENESDIAVLAPDMNILATLHPYGVIATAPGSAAGVDFVSRFFAPSFGIPEDPATGSAHCTLVPYWSARLGRNQFVARQISARGGELFCDARGERVGIAGRAVLYLEGTITV